TGGTMVISFSWLNRRAVFFLVGLASSLLSSPRGVTAAAKLSLAAILEASPEDYSLFEPAEVIEVCSEALQATPAPPAVILPEIYRARGDAYLTLKSIKEAERDYRRFTELRQGDPEAIWRHTRVLCAQGNNDSAIRELKSLIRNHPG